MSLPASIISDEVSQDLSAVARASVRDFRAHRFPLRAAKAASFGHAFKDLTAAEVAEVRNLAAAEGWRIHGCWLADVLQMRTRRPGGHLRADLEWGLPAQPRRRAGASVMRARPGSSASLRRPEALSVEIVDRIAAHLIALADLAAAAGVRIGMENESSCRIGTGAEILRLGVGKAHRTPAVGWIWDPCNVLYVPGATGPATAHFSGNWPRGWCTFT